MAESARIKHILAESANAANGLHRLLTRSQHLTTAKTCHQEKDLSVKTCFGKIQKNHILAEAAILCR
jgi:hypothetical protein